MTPSRFPRRGEVYWTALDPAQGAEMEKTRPCVVVTVDPVNRRRWTVVVIPLSQTGPKGFPLYVPIASISVGSQAVVDQIRVVDRERLLKLEGTATESEMRLLAEAMKDVFGLH